MDAISDKGKPKVWISILKLRIDVHNGEFPVCDCCLLLRPQLISLGANSKYKDRLQHICGILSMHISSRLKKKKKHFIISLYMHALH